jgi:predicted TIM-barrel fold metal-dependent hydrolase
VKKHVTDAPPERIIDAHHHVWRLDRTPWLAGPPEPRIFGDYDPLRRDYPIEEYAADVRGQGVVGSVYVQVNVALGDEVEEVEWAAEAGAREGLVQGVVAFADLARPDVGEVLDRQRASSVLRGVRQQLHWHPDPAYRFAATPDGMLRPEWQRGLMEVAARGLLFELQVFPDQYQYALRLVDAFPNTTFVLVHAGMLEDRSEQGWAAWRRGLERFAERDNVYLKLSGLGTFTRRCAPEDWRPVIGQAVDIFGPQRCMFGSNFPIEKLWTTYGTLIDVFRAGIASYSGAEQRQILHDVAARVYRIPAQDSA